MLLLPVMGTGIASSSSLIRLAGVFMKAGAFSFGSGLAIVPFLHQGVVLDYQWLNERQFLDAVAVGIITTGPVVIMAAFVGYRGSSAAWRSGRRNSGVSSGISLRPFYWPLHYPPPRQSIAACVCARRNRGRIGRDCRRSCCAWRGFHYRYPNRVDWGDQPDCALQIQNRRAIVDWCGRCSLVSAPRNCERNLKSGG